MGQGTNNGRFHIIIKQSVAMSAVVGCHILRIFYCYTEYSAALYFVTLCPAAKHLVSDVPGFNHTNHNICN